MEIEARVNEAIRRFFHLCPKNQELILENLLRQAQGLLDVTPKFIHNARPHILDELQELLKISPLEGGEGGGLSENTKKAISSFVQILSEDEEGRALLEEHFPKDTVTSSDKEGHSDAHCGGNDCATDGPCLCDCPSCEELPERQEFLPVPPKFHGEGCNCLSCVKRREDSKKF